jgi:hypothetical protein
VDAKKDCCKNGADRFSLKAPAPTSSASSSPSSSGTPVGAIAGGVVGGVAALVILVGLGWWLYRRKRQTGQYAKANANAPDAYQGPKTPPKDSQFSKPPIVEADAGPEHVLVEADSQPVQRRTLHELPA